jgi:ABC-type Na+ efflux pump permease subunit
MDDRKSPVAALILGASGPSATPVVLLIGFGVVVAIVGHLAGSRRTVVVGIAILFVATVLLIVGAYVSFSDDVIDPRQCDAPGGC